ncbi:uncharacterized protein N7483_010102 [Penicillium malachiteum]|uniref:uncharacterized protein n=1 Tax=Penicillium malachiteum TaxID=1324776 RepID=UPI00254802C8|nr:uncharacterized protein N7483_010102 [Penicillium malachiteum]KAJ5712921.1 hypothetical protein N7483_010102 [Penicillium malachiteum]
MSSAEESDDANLVVIPMDDCLSDGRRSTWPEPGGSYDYRQLDDSRWKAALATMWVEKNGAQEEGKLQPVVVMISTPNLIMDERERNFPGDPYLWSTGRTKAEMEAARAMETRAMETRAMEDGESRTTTSTPTPTSTATATPSPAVVLPDRETTPEVKLPEDVDGPDYWKMHITTLKQNKALDKEIHHPLNLDWVLTHEWLENFFVRLRLQPSFLPRRGELVLWTHELNHPLEWNKEANRFMVRKGNVWTVPEWRAGVVTQVPEEATGFLDIVQKTEKTSDSVSYWGFRIESLPDPIGDDKSLSLHYKYVPLSCIKPFSSFERFLFGIPRENLHPSIENAMTVMASWSLLSHSRFTGTWPNARIYSRGIFIGPDLLAIQDAVRLKPFGLQKEDIEEGNTTKHTDYDPVDVMVIEKIWLELDACNDDPKNPQLANQCIPVVAGKVYTRDPNRLDRHMPFDKDPLQKMLFDEVSSAFRQIGMSNYGDWYRVSGGRTCVVSPPMILGRCYEPEATMLHFGADRLDYDLHGVLNGRSYSSQVDTRIPKGLDWFWGDCRVETLGLITINGFEVGHKAVQRENPTRWQAILRILSGPYSDVDIRKAELPRNVGRPARKEFSGVEKTSLLVSTGLGLISQTESSDEDDGSESETDDTTGNESEMDLSESELLAPIPFRGGTEETEGGDYDPGNDYDE